MEGNLNAARRSGPWACVWAALILAGCAATDGTGDESTRLTPIAVDDAAAGAVNAAEPGALDPDTPPIDVSTLQAVAIPRDGVYGGRQVEGAAVGANVVILQGGQTVRISEAGFGRSRTLMEFYRGQLPIGYFDSARIDSNGDGEVRDELVRKGIWRMDESGNVVRLQ